MLGASVLKIRGVRTAAEMVLDWCRSGEGAGLGTLHTGSPV